MMNKQAYLLVGLVFSVNSHSAMASPSVNQTALQYKSAMQTAQTIEATRENRDQFQREQWNLDETEWSRYQELMKGIRGSISPNNISPIEVLGTHARNDEERMKYARLWVRIMYDDAQRVLAFQRAYSQAFNELYGHLPIIDTSQLNTQRASKSVAQIQTNDRVLLFVKLTDCPECESLVQRVLTTMADKNGQLDIYFTDAKDQQDNSRIRRWAAKQGLDKKKLKQGRITLNHDHGALFGITKQLTTPVPVVYKTDETQTIRLSL